MGNTACLPSCRDQFSHQFNNGTGVRCWVAGWGKNEVDGSFQFIQHKVDLPLVEDKTGPGELSRARLSVLKTASRRREVPSAALLPRVHHPFVATVPHTFELASSLSRGNARPTESGVVDGRIVAASLLAKRASVQGLSVSVGIGSVHDSQPKAVLGLLGPLGSLLPQRLHPWIDQSAANKVIVVVDVTTKGVAALLVLGNAAALAEAACELSSTWNSAGRGLAAAALLGEGARLASTSTSLGQT